MFEEKTKFRVLYLVYYRCTAREGMHKKSDMIKSPEAVRRSEDQRVTSLISEP